MKINIGNSVHEIKLVDEMRTPEGDLVLGEYRPFEEAILVSKNFPTQVKRQTLWHEVVHGMFDEIGVDELQASEGLIDALAKQLYGFFSKNDIEKIYSFLGDNNGKTDKTKVKAKS